MRYFKLILYNIISFSLLILSSCALLADSNFQFYDRVEICINGVTKYLDYIKITNYQNNSLTAKEMYKFGEQYVDTVQADKIVEAVTFVSEKPFNSLPEDAFDDYSGKISKNSLLGFSFTSTISKDTPLT